MVVLERFAEPGCGSAPFPLEEARTASGRSRAPLAKTRRRCGRTRAQVERLVFPCALDVQREESDDRESGATERNRPEREQDGEPRPEECHRMYVPGCGLR